MRFNIERGGHIMKKMMGVGIMLAVMMFSGIAYAQCDLAVGFNVTISGKVIEDGYYASNFTTGIVYFDICTSPSGDTADYFEGFLYDDDYDYWAVAGTIIWNRSFTVPISRGRIWTRPRLTINGTVKYSRGKFTLSGIGGNSDGEYLH